MHNGSMVSFHTMVAYFPGDRNQKILQSYVVMSDVLSHNTRTIYKIPSHITIIKEDNHLVKKYSI